MPPLKVGVVGVGKLGNYHCNALTQITEADLGGIYDLDRARAAEIAHNYHCQSFETVQDLIDSVDVVGVIVPTTFHRDVAVLAIESKKPVFIEKPIATTVEEAVEIVRLAEKFNVPVQIGHIERFNPALRALEGGNLGPRFIESHRLAPFDPRGTDVAVILDLMIHDIDIILSLVNSPVQSIHANGVAVVSDEVDIANTRIQFENGCVANVTASRISQRKMRKMRLFQRDEYVSIDFLQKLAEVYRLVSSSEQGDTNINIGQIEKGKYKRSIVYDKPAAPEDDAMQAEWKSFLYNIETGNKPSVSGEDGLNALRIALQIRDTILEQQV